jgi:actin-related protein
MLITEAPMTSARHREQLAQLVFEKLRVPALHVAPCPTLALYGSGRTTGVVLDVGDTVMSATPIYEGAL